MATVIRLDHRRRYAAAVARYRRLSVEERDAILQRTYIEKRLENLTFFEQVAVEEDAAALPNCSPADEEAEIAALLEPDWERD
jgi:hypothetical protein